MQLAPFRAISSHGGAYNPRAGPLTLELSHAGSTQSVQLPTETLDENRKYYVTFTINKVAKDSKQVEEEEKAERGPPECVQGRAVGPGPRARHKEINHNRI